MAIGCDGTVINTEFKNRVIRVVECDIKRQFQRITCLLHTNELPLHHLNNYLDGTTSGPKGFPGDIGKTLISCEHLPVEQFQKIESILFSFDLEIVSMLSIFMYHGISIGVLQSNLSLKAPRKIL